MVSSSVLWIGVSSDTSIHRWGLVYLCDDAGFETPIRTDWSSKFRFHQQHTTVRPLLIPGGHTEHEEQVAKVPPQRSVCIISWVRMSSSEVTQWLLRSRATLRDRQRWVLSRVPVSERTRWGSGKKKKNHSSDLQFQCCCQCFYQRCLPKAKWSCCKQFQILLAIRASQQFELTCSLSCLRWRETRLFSIERSGIFQSSYLFSNPNAPCALS